MHIWLKARKRTVDLQVGFQAWDLKVGPEYYTLEDHDQRQHVMQFESLYPEPTVLSSITLRKAVHK